MQGVVVNTRVLRHHLTGQPRHAREILARLGDTVQQVQPGRDLPGMAGHAWEQFVLPARVRHRLLWSPSTSGPVAVARQVVTIHDVAPIDHPEWFAPRFAQWYGWLVPRLARRCAHVLTVSEFCRQRIIDVAGVPPDHVSVVPNGIDDRMRPTADAAARAALALPAGRYVLTLSSLEPRKNLIGVIAAWRAALPDLPEDVSLVVAGGTGVDHVFASAEFGDLPPRVVLTGRVPDEHLPGLYSGATAFVFLSHYEGFGLPPLEAMACGTPTLVSNVTAIPEVVDRAAVAVPPNDIEAAAAALCRLVADGSLRAELSAAGLDRARAFSWDTSAEQVWAVLSAAAS